MKSRLFLVKSTLSLLVMGILGIAPYSFAQTGLVFQIEVTADETTAQVVLKNNSGALNSFQTTVFFDPNIVEVTSASTTLSLCEEQFIVNKIIDNEAGIVYLECGSAIPFTGSSTTLLELDLKYKQSVTANLIFGNRNLVARHDGLGTNLTPLLLNP